MLESVVAEHSSVASSNELVVPTSVSVYVPAVAWYLKIESYSDSDHVSTVTATPFEIVQSLFGHWY